MPSQLGRQTHCPASQRPAPGQPAPQAQLSTHRPPLQIQPAAQVIVQGRGTQLPPAHSWFELHWKLAPQRQPPLVQLSARIVSQAVQPLPLLPHVDRDGVVQVPLKYVVQQPPGHEAESQ